MEWAKRSTIMLGLLAWVSGSAACVRAQAVPRSVDDCVRLALAQSPAARAAGFDVIAAQARLRAAHAAYAPRVSAQAEYGRTAGFDEAVTNGGSTAALLTIETSFLDGGLRDANFAAAGARLRSAKALEQQRRADVAFTVRTTYFTALAANAEGGIQHDTLSTLRSYEALLERQERLGLVTRNDVLRARLAADNSAAAERGATANCDAALSELSTLTGTDVTTASLAEPGGAPLVDVEGSRIDTSPVLIDAQASVESARHEADAVRSEWRSHLQLTASGGAVGIVPDRTFHDNGGGQFLFGFSVPLYDGGATAARVAAAAAAADSAEAALRESRQSITRALARASVERRRAEADRTAWAGTLPRAAENFALMRARYFGGGNVRLLEVLDALAQYVDAQLAGQRANLMARLAVAKQQQLVGEGTP